MKFEILKHNLYLTPEEERDFAYIDKIQRLKPMDRSPGVRVVGNGHIRRLVIPVYNPAALALRPDLVGAVHPILRPDYKPSHEITKKSIARMHKRFREKLKQKEQKELMRAGIIDGPVKRRNAEKAQITVTHI